MNRHPLFGVARTAFVDLLAKHVEDSAQGLCADRNGHWATGIDNLHAAHHSFGAAQGDCTDTTAAEVLLHFADQVDRDAFVLRFNSDRVVDRRQCVVGKLNVKGRSDHLRDTAVLRFGCD